MSDGSRGPSSTFRPLTGLSIVELGDGQAGATATDILASLGADVTTVVDSDSILRTTSPVMHGRSISSVVLDSRKRALDAPPADEVRRLIAAADVVVVDRLHGPANARTGSAGSRDRSGYNAADRDAYLDAVAIANPGVWATISAYGLSGLRADRPGSDLTVAAAGGWLSLTVDPATGRPTSIAGSQALQTAGAAAALAVCHAISERRATGELQHADVSAQAAAMMAGSILQTVGPLLATDEPGGSRRFGAPAGLFDCQVGSLCITAMEQHQWLGVVRTLGNPEWAKQYDRVDARIDRAAECNAAIAVEFAKWNPLELEVRLQQEGVPAGATRGPLDLLDSPQIASRSALRTLVIGDQPARVIDTTQSATEAGSGQIPKRPATIRGLRVLEAGHVLAVPLAGALLGACGADVVKLEDARRPDSYRTRGPYVDGHTHTDWCAYYALANHSKHSLEVDLSQPRVVSALLDSADVLMENYGPSRARRLMIDARQAVEQHPQLLAISSSGYGHTGPWGSYRAYAYNLHAAAGVVHFTRAPDGRPVHVEMALADLMTAYAMATYVAASAIGPGRRTGVGLDVAMAEAVTARFNTELVAAELAASSGDDLSSAGTADNRPERRAPFAPNGIYASADDRWLTLSVFDDTQWSALIDELGSPADLGDGRWSDVAGRMAGVHELDAALASAIGGRDAEELVSRLVARGVPASVVWSPIEVITGSDHVEDGYLLQVDHPLWGRRRLPGLPWRLVDRPPVDLVPPPYLGNARDDIGSWAHHLARLVETVETGATEPEAAIRRPPSHVQSSNRS